MAGVLERAATTVCVAVCCCRSGDAAAERVPLPQPTGSGDLPSPPSPSVRQRIRRPSRLGNPPSLCALPSRQMRCVLTSPLSPCHPLEKLSMPPSVWSIV